MADKETMKPSIQRLSRRSSFDHSRQRTASEGNLRRTTTQGELHKMEHFQLRSGELTPKSFLHPSLSRPTSRDPSMKRFQTEENQLRDFQSSQRQPIEPAIVLSNWASGAYEALNREPDHRQNERKEMRKLLRTTCQPTTMADIFQNINQRINDGMASIVLGGPVLKSPDMKFRVAIARNFEHENLAETRVYKRCLLYTSDAADE